MSIVLSYQQTLAVSHTATSDTTTKLMSHRRVGDLAINHREIVSHTGIMAATPLE